MMATTELYLDDTANDWQELLDLDLGTVVQLDKPANANVDVYVNQKLVARGEVVVAEDNFGIRIKEIIAKAAG